MRNVARCVAVMSLICAGKFVFADDMDTGRRRLVSIEIVIAETGDKSVRTEGLDATAAEKQIARIRELEAQGKLSGLTRVRMSTLEECLAVAHLGEKTPYVINESLTQSSLRDARAATRPLVYHFQETGTVISATPRVEDEGTILIELRVEKTSVARDAARIAAEADRPAAPVRMASIRSESTIRVPPGQTVIVQGVGAATEKESLQSVILVTARVEHPIRAAGGKPATTRAEYEIKIFALKNAAADSAAAIVGSIFEGRPVKVAIDERTNSLILQGPRREFEAIEAILLRLDESPASPARERK